MALRLFAASALAAADPANDAFWLHDAATGEICLAGQPWGTKDPFWNFSTPAAADYWVNTVIGELATESALTAGGGSVFFDEVDQGECGYRGSNCDFAQFNATALQAAKIATYGRQVRAMNAAGIVPILSLDNRLAASGAGTAAAPPCALPEDALVDELRGTLWARFYENWPETFWAPGGADLVVAMHQNAILEAAAGVPNVLHIGGSCPAPARNISVPGRLGGDVEFAVASYLVVAGPGTTLSISGNWYDANFCWRPDCEKARAARARAGRRRRPSPKRPPPAPRAAVDVDFGAPTGAAVRNGYVFSRNYTKATATVDLSTKEGVVMLL